MSEEGIDDVVERGLRQLLAASGQIAERVARLRQELKRQQQQATDRATQEQLRALATDRANMRAALAPVNEPQWWNAASAEQIAGVYEAAEAWKDYDPAALQASERIREEVSSRYGIDTAEVQGDRAYLQDAVDTKQAATASAEELRKHNEAMALIAAANAAELHREAQGLRGEVERLQVPEQYLADPALLEALRGARDASDVDARVSAERVVSERVHLINEDGLHGPTIEQLRDEISGSYSGADDSLFQDAAFVAAAKDWHEARVLAEGGFVSRDSGLEARYEASEKELFSRIDALGRGIEKNVLTEHQAAPSSTPQVGTRAGTATYGSAEHRKAFAATLDGTGSPEEVRGRLVAAADQGSHPREATRQTGKVPATSRRSPTSSPIREAKRTGPTR